MSRPSSSSVWGSLGRGGLQRSRAIWTADREVVLSDLAAGSALGGRLGELRDRSVLLWTRDQLAAAIALIEIDGIARRLVLCPPDLDPAHLPYVVATAEIEAIVTDRRADEVSGLGIERVVQCQRAIRRAEVERADTSDTEWILFTSGTTGVPKMVVHTLATLTGAINPAGNLGGPVVWATFYDIRRYGGLQILLRALSGGGSLLLSSAGETPDGFIERAKAHAVTHITGTPSHWRRALMTPTVRSLSPAYARLSGEIADQAVIDHLQATFPLARVAHAFAST